MGIHGKVFAISGMSVFHQTDVRAFVDKSTWVDSDTDPGPPYDIDLNFRCQLLRGKGQHPHMTRLPLMKLS